MDFKILEVSSNLYGGVIKVIVWQVVYYYTMIQVLLYNTYSMAYIFFYLLKCFKRQ